MCCEQLVCANCAQRVIDAGCSVCRVARAEIHGPTSVMSAAWLAIVLVTLLAAAAILYGGLAR